jgi:hypothetical protein
MRSLLALALITISFSAPAYADSVRLEINMETKTSYALSSDYHYVVREARTQIGGYLRASVNGQSIERAIPSSPAETVNQGSLTILPGNRVRIVGADLSTTVEVQAVFAADQSFTVSRREMSSAMRQLMEPQLSQYVRQLESQGMRGNLEVKAHGMRCQKKFSAYECELGVNATIWVRQ